MPVVDSSRRARCGADQMHSGGRRCWIRHQWRRSAARAWLVGDGVGFWRFRSRGAHRRGATRRFHIRDRRRL